MNCIYQFFNFTSADNLYNKIININKSGAVAVFDLEDSFLVPFNENYSRELKSSARKLISGFIESSDVTGLNLGIRINQCSSTEILKDLSFLENFNYLNWKCIFLPKVENISHLKEYIRGLIKSKIMFENLIPIVESKKGMANLRNICGSMNAYGISEAAFGHCDYNLDAGFFPFNHLDSDILFNIIKNFYKTLNGYSLGYVNTPYLKLNDSSGFRIILKNIFNILDKDFSQVTLCKEQTEVCNSLKNNVADILPFKVETITEKNEYAEKIISLYNSNSRKEKSIIVNVNRELFSPHEYAAAVKYIESIN